MAIKVFISSTTMCQSFNLIDFIGIHQRASSRSRGVGHSLIATRHAVIEVIEIMEVHVVHRRLCWNFLLMACSAPPRMLGRLFGLETEIFDVVGDVCGWRS